MARALLTLGLALPLLLVNAQDNRSPDPNNRFLYPPLPGPQFSNDPTVFAENPNFTSGVEQSAPFKWITNMTSMYVSMFQEGNPESVQTFNLTECGDTANFVYWDGNLGPIDLANGSVAFLAAWNCSQPEATPIFFSHYFNITETKESSASSSATSAAATSTSGSATSTSGAASPSKTAAPAAAGSSSNAAAIGGGVGGGLGALCILLAVGLIWLHRKRQKDKKTMHQSMSQNQNGTPPDLHNRQYGGSYHPTQSSSALYNGPVELSNGHTTSPVASLVASGGRAPSPNVRDSYTQSTSTNSRPGVMHEVP